MAPAFKGLHTFCYRRQSLLVHCPGLATAARGRDLEAQKADVLDPWIKLVQGGLADEKGTVNAIEPARGITASH